MTRAGWASNTWMLPAANDLGFMQVRAVQPRDLEPLDEIDGVIDSRDYLHVEKSGEGLSLGWTLHERPLRERRIQKNALDDERRFMLKQIVSGAEEGIALLAEHEDVPVALLLAGVDPAGGTIRVHELRVDFDHRRQGLATVLMYQLMADARERQMRAVAATSKTDNFPAAKLLSKLGFELTGLDLQRESTHDLVKEAVTLFWYAPLD